MKKAVLVGSLIFSMLILGLWFQRAHATTSAMTNDRIEIKQNRLKWQHLTAKMTHPKTSLSNDECGVGPASNLETLKLSSDYLISGTVYNLERMPQSDGRAVTRVTIKVDRVIKGERKLRGKFIKTAMNSGIIRDSGKDVLIEYDQYPLPIIGSKIITGIYKNKSDMADRTHIKYLKANGLMGSDGYGIHDQAYNVWIKNVGDDDYHLNNSAVIDRKSPEYLFPVSEDLLTLTDVINQKFNK